MTLLDERNAHITCLQETWREGIEELEEDGFVFVGVAPDKQLSRRGSQGVGILLSPKAVTAWRAASSFSITDLGPRIAAVKLLEWDPRSRKNINVLYVSAYATVSAIYSNPREHEKS